MLQKQSFLAPIWETQRRPRLSCEARATIRESLEAACLLQADRLATSKAFIWEIAPLGIAMQSLSAPRLVRVPFRQLYNDQLSAIHLAILRAGTGKSGDQTPWHARDHATVQSNTLHWTHGSHEGATPTERCGKDDIRYKWHTILGVPHQGQLCSVITRLNKG